MKPQGLITLVASSLLLGCVEPPVKPTVEMGDIDYPRLEVIAGMSGQPNVTRVPLSTYDKATCFKPSEWEQLRLYLEELRAYADACYQRSKR